MSVVSSLKYSRKRRLTSPPVTFLSAYLAICFLSSLFAAYFPTMAAMMEMWCQEVDVCRLREVELKIRKWLKSQVRCRGLVIKRQLDTACCP